MRNEAPGGPAGGAKKPRLPARVFYGLIVAGVLLGASFAAVGGWLYLESGDRKPTGRRVWDGTAEDFVIPVAVMVGATFGGLAGFAAAAVWERRRLRS